MSKNKNLVQCLAHSKCSAYCNFYKEHVLGKVIQWEVVVQAKELKGHSQALKRSHQRSKIC